MRPQLNIALLVVLLAACSNQDPVIVPQAKPPAPAAAADPAPAAAPAGLLALDGEGLRIFNGDSGASRLLAFGEDAKQATDTLGRVLAETPPAWVENEECSVEFARWSNGLTLWSSQSRFSGWSLTPGSAAISTARGVKLGSTRTELENAYDAEIMESSLGTEFLAGGLAGVLDSPGPDAKISNLWAGETCIAR